MSDSAPNKLAFKQFLNYDILPYFSRALFLSYIESQSYVSEDEWVDSLDSGNKQAALLFGPGGIGKTRLGMELCRRLRARGWLTLKVERVAAADSVDSILRAHVKPARIILFLDYAEAAGNLELIVDGVRRAADDGSHEVRLIATCRASAWRSVSDIIGDMQTEYLELGIANSHEEESYRRWVIFKILDHFGVPNRIEVEDACGGLPVLAAFASFLFRRQPERFKVQFAHLLDIPDFDAWAGRRIAILTRQLGNEPEVEFILADIALQLPLSSSQFLEIFDGGSFRQRVFEALSADYWIEQDGDSYVPTHDVFADALVARFIFGMPGQSTQRLNRLLRIASREKRLTNALYTIDRLAMRPEFSKIEALSIVKGLLASQPEAVFAANERIINGRLLTVAQKIELLATEPQMRAVTAGNRQTYRIVVAIAKSLPSGAMDESRSKARSATEEIVGEVAKLPQISWDLLRSVYQINPDKFRPLIIEKLRTLKATSGHLLVDLIRKEGPTAEVLEVLLTWLDRWDMSVLASFVYRAWLENGGYIEVVQERCFRWLGIHWRDHEAAFVIKSLAAIDDLPSAVLVDMAKWASVHRRHPDALDRVRRISRYLKFSDDEYSLEVVSALVRAGILVLSELLRNENATERDRLSGGIVLLNLFRGAGNTAEYGPIIVRLFAIFVTDGRTFRPKSEINLDPTVLIAMKWCFESGYFNLSRDVEGLRRFFEWVLDAASRSVDIGLMVVPVIARMKIEYPGEFWPVEVA